MEIRIIQMGSDPTVRLAAEELKKYLPMVDPSVETAVLLAGENCSGLRGIRVGVSGQTSADENPELDDAVEIEVAGCEGIITGPNPRSVLIAAYRFLREAGCRWIRPGEDGEKIIPGDLKKLRVSIHEKASYRHRGVCIEGACSYNHVRQIINWMPKVGLNGYFHQFMVPYTFFDKWYSHASNPEMQGQKTSVEEVTAMVEETVSEIKERGMMLHRVGHGWTCEPFGIPGHGWEPQEYHLTEKEAEPFALVNGKRGIWKGISLNTQLCYSNPDVRKTVVEAVVSYSKEHPQVDYIHFWLADEANNHCECERCKDTRPSDYYVRLLNEIDARLTAEKLKTRIVFLVYMDLLWAPEKERIIERERFTLMFAPISRTYTNTFLGENRIGEGKTVPYRRNRVELPTKVEDNIAYLKEWQKGFSGDSFDYDYHLLWDWNFDLGGYRSSQVLFEDMKDLKELGINGMMSCQMQRAAFPTALGMTAMASALWNREQSFDQVADAYLEDVFGTDAGTMKEYFKTLSELFHPPYQRLEEESVNPARAKDFAALSAYVQERQPWFKEREEAAEGKCDRATWKYIRYHAEICVLMAGALEEKAKGNSQKALERWQAAADAANWMEPEVHNVWDVNYFLNVAGAAIRDEKRPGLD